MGTLEERLHLAVRENDLKSVECLLDGGAPIDCVYYGTSALMVAIARGYSDMACLLLGCGCQADVRDQQGVTALQEAVTRNQSQVVKLLLTQKSVCVDQKFTTGQTALTHAALKRLLQVSQILLQAGADVNSRNSRGEAALYIAAREGDKNIVRELLSRNDLHIDVACTHDALTPLMASATEGHLEVVKLLLKSGCDVNVQDAGGWTALWHAVTDSHTDVIHALITGGADVNIVDSDNRTLLQVALENEDDDIIDLLRKAGAR